MPSIRGFFKRKWLKSRREQPPLVVEAIRGLEKILRQIQGQTHENAGANRSFRGAYPSRVWFPASLPENRVGGVPTRTRARFDRLKALSLSKGMSVPHNRASQIWRYVFSRPMDFNAFALRQIPNPLTHATGGVFNSRFAR
jgi:hypothetical protein